MKTLIIKNLCKEYETSKKNFFTALKNVNLSFDGVGLVSIVGKSGSGKSTLLNLLTRIDTPSKGEIILNGKNYSLERKRSKSSFFNKEIGIVFQQYNLLENETAIFNVSLPLLLSGYSKKRANQKAEELLSSVGLDECLFNKPTSVLSGGEKQRVGIARAIANDPSVVFCDEPTGALDSENSIKIMEIIKRVSNSALVIFVSHNLPLVKQYSDRIIEIKDGVVINDQMINRQESSYKENKNKGNRNTSWIGKISFRNYLKRTKRNIVTSLALSITISMVYLVVGFINGKDDSIKNACYKQFDFASGTISKEEKFSNEGLLSLSKSTRPEYKELLNNKEISQKFEICLNYSAILPQNLLISYQSQNLDDLLFTPIYSFSSPYVNPHLIIKGSLPNGDSLDEVVINKYAYNYLSKMLKKDPLYERLTFEYMAESTYINEIQDYISDTFTFHKEIKIVGVVDEINYLPSKKIYYSYSAFDEYIKEITLNNLSTYYDRNITWFDRIFEADNYSPISSYSYYLFFKDYRLSNVMYERFPIPEEYSFVSSSMILSDSLFSFLEVAEYGIILFLIVTLLGTILIMSIMSFASYSEDHKVSAILTVLGAKNDEIQEIYLNESLFNGLLSLVLASVVSIILVPLLNKLVLNFVELKDLIVIPFSSFLGIRFLLPVLMVAGFLFICLFSTLIPIMFSKKRSLKGELQSV